MVILLRNKATHQARNLSHFSRNCIVYFVCVFYLYCVAHQFECVCVCVFPYFISCCRVRNIMNDAALTSLRRPSNLIHTLPNCFRCHLPRQQCHFSCLSMHNLPFSAWFNVSEMWWQIWVQQMWLAMNETLMFVDFESKSVINDYGRNSRYAWLH